MKKVKIENTQEQIDFIKYYESQLNELTASEYPMTIVVYDGVGHKTKHINLNRESLQALIMFFKKLNKRIIT